MGLLFLVACVRHAGRSCRSPHDDTSPAISRPSPPLHAACRPKQVLILFVVELTGAKVLMGAATLPPCSKDESMFLTLLPSREEREAADGGGHADQNGAAALGATPRRSERLKHRSE